MTLQPYFGVSGQCNHIFHDAVHDIESFFWVLVHTCLTRQGPGGVRRQELDDANRESEAYGPLRRLVACLFDSDNTTMAANKRNLFLNPNHLEEFVLVNFHDYFQNVKGLIKEWFHMLSLAYEFRAFEYQDIHDMVLEILDKSLASMPADEIDDAAQKVLSNRQVDIEQLDGNPYGRIQQSPLLHTSPGSREQAFVAYTTPESPTPAPAFKKAKLLRRNNIKTQDSPHTPNSQDL